MENPSLKLKVNTVVWRVKPSRSPSGAVIGITADAIPLPETMIKLMMVLAMYMTGAIRKRGVCESKPASA